MSVPARRPDKLRLGGMALGNGLLVHGPTHWAAAVRSRDGELLVESGRKPRFSQATAGAVPGVRGVLRLAEAFAVIPIVKRSLPQAVLPMQEPRTLATMAAASLAGRALRSGRPRTLAREAAVAALGALPAVFALRGGELAAYHGVEHKSIAAYEQGGSAADAAKEHDRCGSNLVAPMIVSASGGALVLRRAGLKGPLADTAAALASLAFAVEVFAWSERHSETQAAALLRRPGYEIQRLIGTREPTPAQLEVGEAALAEILRVERAAAAS